MTKRLYPTMTLAEAKALLRSGKRPKNLHVRDLLDTMREAGVE